ncbi:MAG TPA: DEAD/DEAH box helicase [Tepidisphaeraceae bacterium]
MKFVDLRLSEPLLRAVAAEGYALATPVQAQSIPHVLEGRDLLGCAQTGTGKTAAFALPILHRLTSTPAAAGRGARTRCLILCPTRELATQIAGDFRTYGKNVRFRVAVIFGGVSQHSQVQALRQGVDIIVATPGRLLDLMGQGHADMRGVETLVLDEADRMLDMGFIHDIRKIVSRLPAQRQTLLFSATMPPEIRRLADSLLKNPASVQIAPISATAEGIKESVYFVEKRNKPALLAHLYNKLPMSRAIVFTRTKHGADRVVRQLQTYGIRSEAIHGNKSQNARQRALENFRASKTPVLVATDIASRGIDIDGVSHVVNFDVSHEPETYVHRIGRTARAGAKGEAVSFCDRDERGSLKLIEKLIRRAIPVMSDHPVYVGEPVAASSALAGEQKQEHGHGQRHGGQHSSQGAARRGESHGGPRRGDGHSGHSPRHASSGHASGHAPHVTHVPRHAAQHSDSHSHSQSHSPRQAAGAHPAQQQQTRHPHPAGQGQKPRHPVAAAAGHAQQSQQQPRRHEQQGPGKRKFGGPASVHPRNRGGRRPVHA